MICGMSAVAESLSSCCIHSTASSSLISSRSFSCGAQHPCPASLCIQPSASAPQSKIPGQALMAEEHCARDVWHVDLDLGLALHGKCCMYIHMHVLSLDVQWWLQGATWFPKTEEPTFALCETVQGSHNYAQANFL